MSQEEVDYGPFAGAVERAIAKAEDQGGHRAAHWIKDGGHWYVPSASHPGEGHTVRRVRPDGPTREQTERQRAANRGWWWFTLHCTCQSQVTHRPYAVCWHKAAVRMWQLWYGRRDGRPWGDRPEWSPHNVHANSVHDAEGIERWKDRGGEWRGDREDAAYFPNADDVDCDCPDDPCFEPRCPCVVCSNAENTRRLMAR